MRLEAGKEMALTSTKRICSGQRWLSAYQSRVTSHHCPNEEPPESQAAAQASKGQPDSKGLNAW